MLPLAGGEGDGGFPLGATLAGGRWAITSRLHGSPDGGLYRAVGDTVVLVTIGPPQRVPAAELFGQLRCQGAGIAPLCYLGPLDPSPAVSSSPPVEVMAEEEPAGRPISEGAWAAPWPLFPEREVARLLRQLAEIVRGAHERGDVLGGLRPELCYALPGAEGARISAVAPRCERFLATARQRSYGTMPCFEQPYRPLEALKPVPVFTPAGDVFSLCAIGAALLLRAYPFPGQGPLAYLEAMMRGETLPLPGPLGALLSRGLAAEPGRRISVAELMRGLDALIPDR
jgi:hypothetical protein